MWLSELNIRNLRCLADAQIEPDPRCNVFIGGNGSGKTSLLESIYLLSRGHSFRTRHKKNLLGDTADYFSVFGKLLEDGATDQALGVLWRKGRLQLRVSGQDVRSASSLSSRLRLLLLTPESHRILEGGPAQRRRVLDWVMFHVEHGHLELLLSYQRSLRQRNASLRQGASTAVIRSWDTALCRDGMLIENWRQDYVDKINPIFGGITNRLLGVILHLELHKGWMKDKDLLSALSDNLESDRRKGYTQSGTHRDHVVVLNGRVNTEESLSRGQSKLVIAAWMLSNLFYVNEICGSGGVLLLDDLPSELDTENRIRLVDIALESESQVFITATSSELLPLDRIPSLKMFHVEHGQVR